MAFNLGDMIIKFKLDASQVQKGLSEVSKSMSTWAQQGRKDLDAFQDELKKTGSQFKTLGRDAALMGTAITGALGLALREYVQFESAMQNVSRVLGENKSQFGEIAAAVENTAKASGLAAEDLAVAFHDIMEAGNSASDSMKIFEAATKLARAGAASIGETGAGLTTLMETYGKSMRDATDGADLLFKAQQMMRGSMSELSASAGQFLPVAAGLGIKAEDVFAAFSKMTVALGGTGTATTALTGLLNGLLKPTAELQKKTQEWYGMTVSQALEQGKMLDIMKKLGELSDEEITKMMPKISGLKGLVAVSQDYAKVQQMSIDLQTRSGIVEKEYQSQMDTTGAQLDRAKEAWKALIREGIEPLAISLKGLIADVLLPTLKGLQDWIKEHESLAGWIIKTTAVIGPFLIVMGSMLMLIGQVIQGIASWKLASLALLATTEATSIGIAKSAVAMTSWSMAGKAALAFLTGPAGLVIAISIAVIEVGKMTMAFMAMREAQKAALEGMNANVQTSTSNIKTMTENLTKRFDTELAGNKELMDQWILLKAQMEEHTRLVNERMATGEELSIKEAEAFQKQEANIVQQVYALEKLTQTEKAAQETKVETIAVEDQSLAKKKELADAITEEARAIKEKEVLEKIANDTTGSTMFTNEDLLALKKEMVTKERELTQAYKDGKLPIDDYLQVNKDLFNTMGSAGITLQQFKTDLATLTGDTHIVKVDLSVEGADELVQLEQDIMRLEHQIQLQRLEGSAQQRATVAFDLEETLWSLDIEDARRVKSHTDTLARIEKEKADAIEAEEKKGRETGKLNGEAVVALEANAKRAIEIENDTFAKFEQNIKLKRQMEIQLQTEKMVNVKEIEKATEAEIEQTGVLVSKIKEVTSAYSAAAAAKRQLASIAEGSSGGGQAIAGGTRIVTPTGPSPYVPAPGYSAGKSSVSGPMTEEAWSSLTGNMAKSYASGTDFVPHTGYYRLHKGEKVTPADQGGGGMQITIVNRIDRGFLNDLLMEDPSAIINIIGSDVAKGGMTKRVITSLMRNS